MHTIVCRVVVIQEFIKIRKPGIRGPVIANEQADQVDQQCK